jgi:hypothetical protein
MTITLTPQNEAKLRRAIIETGMDAPELLDRALDSYLQDVKMLNEETKYWQGLYMDTLALEDERLANLTDEEYGHRRNMDN